MPIPGPELWGGGGLAWRTRQRQRKASPPSKPASPGVEGGCRAAVGHRMAARATWRAEGGGCEWGLGGGGGVPAFDFVRSKCADQAEGDHNHNLRHEGCITRGGRVQRFKDPKICVPKLAQIHFFFIKYHFLPL